MSNLDMQSLFKVFLKKVVKNLHADTTKLYEYISPQNADP